MHHSVIKHTILIVDDNEAALDIERQWLEKDYNVLTASSGGRALEILKTTKVHVILTDQVMPTMTGVELLREARKKYNGEIVRILYTAGTDKDLLLKALQDGDAWKYVLKPHAGLEITELMAAACKKSDGDSLLGMLSTIDERLRVHIEGDEKVSKSILSTMSQMASSLERARELQNISRVETIEHRAALSSRVESMEVSIDIMRKQAVAQGLKVAGVEKKIDDEMAAHTDSQPGVDPAALAAIRATQDSHSTEIGSSLTRQTEFKGELASVKTELEVVKKALQGIPAPGTVAPTMTSLAVQNATQIAATDAALVATKKNSMKTTLTAIFSGIVAVAVVAKQVMEVLKEWHIIK